MKTRFFHVYNRGAHKASIFHDKNDYERFVQLLYMGNSTKPLVMRDVRKKDMYCMERNPLVEIHAYCLMPNHFHIALKEIADGGITLFLKKVDTGYSMYYNIKYKHSGTIFQGRSKTKFVGTKEYLSALINYIHLNPYGLQEPNLKDELHTDPVHLAKAVEISKEYEYSSFKDFIGVSRPQSSIIQR
jgi:putative transposase